MTTTILPSSSPQRWQRYPKYKQSDVEWLGEMPEWWDQKRLRFLCSITTGSKNTEDSDPSSEYPFFVRSDKVEHLSSYSFDDEAVITAGDGVGVARVFHYYNGKFDAHQRVYVLTRFKGIEGRFFYYYFKQNLADEVLKISAKSTVDSLRLPMLQNFTVCVPPLPEQHTIAAFLDRETARIDALIAKKECQIELLKEKRAALISHTVTKGLNPNAKMKDSGIEWLGMVPDGWKMIKLEFLATVKARLGWKGLKADEYQEKGNILLSTPNIKNTEIDFVNVNYITDFRYLESPEIMLQKGDVLIAKDGSTLGTVNIIRDLPEPATVNSSIAVIRPRIGIISLFLYYLLTSHYIQSTIQLMKGGQGVPHLFQEDLRKFLIWLPPLPEQNAIAAFLDRETARIDGIIDKINCSIENLNEYRSTIISAAVTGKIDVREEVAG